MGRIIACVNEKCGVAKTTTIKNLSVGVAMKGFKVLAIDLDPSANLTKCMRLAAAGRAAGLDKIPAVIRPMDDYESTVLMVYSNLYRPAISIKEKARVYRMCHDAEKHQGRHIGGDTAASIGASASDSRRKVYRYIRLSYLTDRLLDMVDGKKLAVNIGVELSYLQKEVQQILCSAIEEYGILPSPEQSVVLRKLSEDGEGISKEKIIALLLGDAKKKESKNSVSFKKKDIQDFFEPDTDIERMSEIIMRLLAKYKEGVLDGFID